MLKYTELPAELFCGSPEFKTISKESFSIYCILRANCKELLVKIFNEDNKQIEETKLVCCLDVNTICQNSGFNSLTFLRLIDDLRKRRWIEFLKQDNEVITYSLGHVEDNGSDNWLLEKKLDEVRAPNSSLDHSTLQSIQLAYFKSKLEEQNSVKRKRKSIKNNMLNDIKNGDLGKEKSKNIKKIKIKPFITNFISLYKSKYYNLPEVTENDDNLENREKRIRLSVYFRRLTNHLQDNDSVDTLLPIMVFLFKDDNWERVLQTCTWLHGSKLTFNLFCSPKLWGYYDKFYREGIPTVDEEKLRKVNLMQRYIPEPVLNEKDNI